MIFSVMCELIFLYFSLLMVFFFFFPEGQIDPRHRYGHNLHFYYEEWRKTDAGQPFFYW